MKKMLVVFGTRPEAIKMAPLIAAFAKYPDQFQTRICVTAQHREMLDQVLDFFELEPDYDLDLMRSHQDLNQLSADIITSMKPVLDDFNPDYVFVHGDTTTSTMAALASFYHGTKICHIEAGLRTYNKLSPFPEEINRQLTARLADHHFAPTEQAKNNLMSEGIASENITVTGNTVIDALLYASEKVENMQDAQINELIQLIDPAKKIILVTGHRRENFGGGFKRICGAIKIIAAEEEVQVIYPVHLNPSVQKQVFEELGQTTNITLIRPLTYPAFVWLMKRCTIIITDSGGIQEEAPALGKPVLLTRDTTERPEAIAAGTVLLVGTDISKIVAEANRLLNDDDLHEQMSRLTNPYGNGKAAENIVREFLSAADK